MSIIRPAAPPATPFTPPTEGAEGRHLADWLPVFRKHRRLAIVTFLLVAVPAAVVTLSQTPIYQATARVLLATPGDTQIEAITRPEASARSAESKSEIETQVELLQSRALTVRVIRNLELSAVPEFATPAAPWWDVRRFWQSAPPPPAATDVAPAASTNPEAPAQADAPATTTAAADDDIPVPGRVVGAVRQALSVAPLTDSRLVDIKFESADPAMAARVANGFAQAYIETELESKFAATKQAGDWLEARLEEQRKKVTDAEMALQNYKQQQDALSVEDQQNIVVQRLSELNAAATRAKTERIGKEEVWNQIDRLRTDRSALESYPLILQNPFVSQLRTQLADLQRQQAQLSERYGERHPEMVRVKTAIESTEKRLVQEVDKTVEGIRGELNAARQQERSLTNALDAQKAETLSLNRKGLEYDGLEREAVSHRQLYEALLRQANRVGLESEVKATSVRIVEPAEAPGVPIRPDTFRTLLLSTMAGLLLAAGLVVARELLDRRLRTPEEVQSALGVPCIGLMPIVDGIKDPDTAPIMDVNAPPQFSEAVRQVRIEVMLGIPGEGTRVLLVTSTAPREGKTVVASNIAAALGAADERVLIIDADMRRPRVHHALDAKREPGLSSALVGRIDPRAAIAKTTLQGVSVLPAGPQPPNPTELFAQGRFRKLLDAVAGDFDWIIVDSPPVRVVSDALILAQEVSGIVFVVGADMTRRDTARDAIDMLKQANRNVIGAVLNQAELVRHASYYGRYYNASYASYYTARE